MQTVDMVIAGVGVFAILATTLGLVYYDEAAGLEDLRYEEVDGTTVSDARTTLSAGTHEFAFAIPQNGTVVSFDLSLQGTRNPVGTTAASAGVEVFVMGPNGTVSDTVQANINFDVGSGNGNGQATVSLRFAEPPADQNSTAPTDDIRDWGNDTVTVFVQITNPSAAGPVAGPVTYNYSITVDGTFTVYQRAAPEIPEPTSV